MIKDIINGWRAYFKGEHTGLAKIRAESCKFCKHAVVGTYEQLLPDYSIKEIKGLKCNLCGCPLSAKLRSKDEKCPINHW